MNEPIDANSLVLTQDAPTTAGIEGAQPTSAVMPPVDIQSLAFSEKSDPPIEQPKPLFQRVMDFAANPVGELSRSATDLGSNKGQSDASKIEFLPLEDDTNKTRDSNTIANLTGIPQADIENHYDALKTLFHFTPQGAGEAGLDIGKRVHPATTEGIISAVMTPALVASALVDPTGTAAGLVAFTALDKLIPTENFIPKGATKDQAASIRVLGMIAKGALTGGLLKGAEHATNMDSVFNMDDLDMSDLLEKHGFQKLQEHGLPDVITLHPDAVEKIAQIDAQKRMDLKNDKRRQNVIGDLQNKLMENEKMPDNVDPSIIREAKQNVVDEINAKEAAGEKLKNREKQVRFDLMQDLDSAPAPETIMGTLGVDENSHQTAVANKLGIKVPAEKLIILALKSPETMDQVAEIIAKSDPSMISQEKAPGGAKIVDNQASMEQDISGEKVSKAASDVNSEIVALGFEELSPEDQASFDPITKAEQLQMVGKMLEKDYEKAKKMATTGENIPKKVHPQVLFNAVKNKAIAEADVNTLRDLALSPIAKERSLAAQSLAASGFNNTEAMGDPVRAMQELVTERERQAQKKLGSKKLETAKNEIVEDIEKEIDQKTPTKEALAAFVAKLKC